MAFQYDQLNTLVVVVEEGTFEAAAQRLHITASAVSQRIKAMEQAAGQVLLQRVNPVLPTAAGDVLLRYGRQVQLLEGDAATLLGSLGVTPGGTISLPLAVNADCLATWFLEALAPLTLGHDVVFDLHREDQEHTTALLRSGTVMAAVTSTAEAVQGCTTQELGIMRYHAVCTPAFADHWFEGGSRTERLDVAPLVNFDRKDALQQRFLRVVAGHDVRSPRHYVPTSADFARAVLLGFGWGLLPEQQCSAELGRGELVELAPEHTIDVPLYWQRWNLDSPLLDAVSSAVLATARERLIAM